MPLPHSTTLPSIPFQNPRAKGHRNDVWLVTMKQPRGNGSIDKMSVPRASAHKEEKPGLCHAHSIPQHHPIIPPITVYPNPMSVHTKWYRSGIEFLGVMAFLSLSFQSSEEYPVKSRPVVFEISKSWQLPMIINFILTPFRRHKTVCYTLPQDHGMHIAAPIV